MTTATSTNFVERPIGFGQAIGNFFRKYASFQGTATRAEFIYPILLIVAIQIAMEWLLNSSPQHAVALGMPYLVFALAIIIPFFSLGARRLHDLGYSGWWQLLLMVPIVGILLLLGLCAIKSR